MLGASAAVCLGEPAVVRPLCQVKYPAAQKGRAAESTATPMGAENLLVTVVTPGADATRPSVTLGNQKIVSRVTGYDPVSNLSLLKAGSPESAKPLEWRNDSNSIVGNDLNALTPGGPVKCRASGWVKQVGTKIPPFALLQVTFNQAVPRPGTPLLDSSGKVAAIIFDGASQPNLGYAIPAEAVHRVRRDLASGGRLVKGWLGISLLAQNKQPRVVKVIPNSPAASAGIRQNDLLLTIGTRKISDFADASNAFFYQIPGIPVRVKVLRGTQELEYDLTPARPPAR